MLANRLGKSSPTVVPKVSQIPLINRGAQLVHADGIPLLKLIKCGRDGEAPLVVRLRNLRAVASQMSLF